MTGEGLPEGHVFIGTSLDGFIARKDGDIAWLDAFPVIEGEDFGYAAFMAGIDAVLMGRGTFEKVLTFPDWPFTLPVTVLSTTLAGVPSLLDGRATVDTGPPEETFARLGRAGAERVYVDGGRLVQSCLRAGLIRRMTLTRLPVLLGEGIPLFGPVGRDVALSLVSVRSWPNGFVQEVYDIG
jgi:dihydrofolate reductase